MPNHVHAIILIDAWFRRAVREPPADGREKKIKRLGGLVGAFKTVSSKKINQMRGTPGKIVWQRNYYEHVIRCASAGPLSAAHVETMRKAIFDQLPEVLNTFGIICGTGKTVIPKIRVVLETLRPGIFILWQNDGPITRKDRENNLKLISADVMPAIREMGKELDLKSSFEVKPGSRPLAHAGKPETVGSLEPWKAWREAHPY